MLLCLWRTRGPCDRERREGDCIGHLVLQAMVHVIEFYMYDLDNGYAL